MLLQYVEESANKNQVKGHNYELVPLMFQNVGYLECTIPHHVRGRIRG